MQQWQNTPQAISLFETAYADYAASDGAHWEFPAHIEADLNDICDFAYLEDGECPESAWHQYCTAREAAHISQNVQKLNMAVAA